MRKTNLALGLPRKPDSDIPPIDLLDPLSQYSFCTQHLHPFHDAACKRDSSRSWYPILGYEADESL